MFVPRGPDQRILLKVLEWKCEWNSNWMARCRCSVFGRVLCFRIGDETCKLQAGGEEQTSPLTACLLRKGKGHEFLHQLCRHQSGSFCQSYLWDLVAVYLDLSENMILMVPPFHPLVNHHDPTVIDGHFGGIHHCHG